MPAAYIQVHFRQDFFMEANNMNPDQTAPKGGSSLIWVDIVCNIATSEHKQMRVQTTKVLTVRPGDYLFILIYQFGSDIYKIRLEEEGSSLG